MARPEFGSCCEDLSHVLHEVSNPFIRVQEDGVLYLTVGYEDSEGGPALFGKPVVFCPFCGTRLQPKIGVTNPTNS